MSIFGRYGTVLRIFDNNGKTFDRYTICPPRWANEYRNRTDSRMFEMLGASDFPFAPNGFGQHCEGMVGSHLGKRIKWENLPVDVQKFATQNFPEYAPNGEKDGSKTAK